MTAFRTLPPIAHRGLHDARRGIVENTASAFSAAIAGGYAIETDLQPSADEPVVFHDATLDRLTEAAGEVRHRTAAELGNIAMLGTRDRVMTLQDCLDLVDGRAPLFLEIKSRGVKDRAFERLIADRLSDYRGPVFVMSFDPGSVAAMRHFAPLVPRGLSAMRFGEGAKGGLTRMARFRLTHMLDTYGVAPDFLTYEVNDLAVMARPLRRRFREIPIITWTVRTSEERRKARIFADGMIFEGFRPSVGAI